MRIANLAVTLMLCIVAFHSWADLDCSDELYQRLKGRELASLTDREYGYLMQYKSNCEDIEKANRVGKTALKFGLIALIVLAPIAILGFLVDHYAFSRFGERFKQAMFAIGAITTFLCILAVLLVLAGLVYPLVVEHM